MTILRRLLGYVSLRFKEPATCEACGDQFTCGATVTGCWCMQVKLTRDARANLRARYKDCVCRVCLEREAAR
jgi:Cysteine-rich CWC